MIVEELTAEKYRQLVRTPLTAFDSAEFAELNKGKVDAVHYLVFNDGKNRFGGVFGIKDRIIKAPFSAPYACFAPISKDSKILSYRETVQALISFARDRGLRGVRLTLPPMVYAEELIASFCNSLYVEGFGIAGCDLSYGYHLKDFNDDYEMSIDPKARQKLRSAGRHNLTFRVAENSAVAYRIIKENRDQKGYPLWMSHEDIQETLKLIEGYWFIVNDASNEPLAAALVYMVSSRFAQVIYWGNRPGTDEFKPMNYLAYGLLKHCKDKGVEFLDLGPSTENSVPNLGLCDFKQGIGSKPSAKITFYREL